MPPLYDRNFKSGRSSDLLLNTERHIIYEATKHLTDTPEGPLETPDAVLHGSLWHDKRKNELKYYDKPHDKWVTIFSDKFQLLGELLNHLPPENPIIKQFWIHNGVLMYFDGVNWQPIKALVQDGSQFNVSAFENFLLINPINYIGNAIVDYEAIDEWKRFVLDGKLDPEANSQFKQTDEKWNPAWECPVYEPNDPNLPVPPMQKSQFIVPHIDMDRFFVNSLLVNDYDEINKVCIQYPSSKIIDNSQSLIHVNPGKITRIKKRLIKIDRDNPTININSFNTEFYGFRGDDKFGKLLLPENDKTGGDYAPNGDGGVVLSINASQTWDYILAITYTFSWMKSTGKMTKTNNKTVGASYYIANWGIPLNVFVEGYDLEGDQYKLDTASKVVTINTNIQGMDLAILRTCKHEYGYIRQQDINNRGIIKLHKSFQNPLVFVNGEALHPSLGEIEIQNDKIYVQHAKKNMSWCVIEINDLEENHQTYSVAGVTNQMTGEGLPKITYQSSQIQPEHGLVVFIDGLLVNKADIERNDVEGYITIPHLRMGQEYIIISDRKHRLYNEEDMSPALATGTVSESLVYCNGKLIMNDSAFATVLSKETEALEATHGEIKFFLDNDLDQFTGEWAIYNSYKEIWEALSIGDVNAVRHIGYSYENTLRAVRLKIHYTHDDEIYIYTFSYANQIENPLIVNSLYAEPGETEVFIPHSFIPRAGTLSVWIDGVREYYINEHLDGKGFSLPEPVVGRFVTDSEGKVVYENGVPVRSGSKITYVIEQPEKGKTESCIRQILTTQDLCEGSPNVYKTGISLSPGRVTVYVGGLRQPNDVWTVLDNNTLLFKSNTQLIGSKDNYPVSHVMKANGEITQIRRKYADEVMVEVRQEFERIERTIKWNEFENWDISIDKYQLPLEILEAADEILIFVNGLFTGLSTDMGYIKDRARGCLSITESSVVQTISFDPLYAYFMKNNDKYTKWKINNNKPQYIPKINNQITLEWR